MFIIYLSVNHVNDGFESIVPSPCPSNRVLSLDRYRVSLTFAASHNVSFLSIVATSLITSLVFRIVAKSVSLLFVVESSHRSSGVSSHLVASRRLVNNILCLVLFSRSSRVSSSFDITACFPLYLISMRLALSSL